MKRAVLAGVCLLSACQAGGGSTALTTLDDSVSYVVGYQIGNDLKRQGLPQRPEAILRGVREAFAETTPAFPDSVARSVVMSFQQRRLDAATAVGDSFLADNSKKEGVKTTASGLQWQVLKEGRGARPKETSIATVHYRGTLLNGTAFDSSYGGDPVSFPLNQVIPGWREGVQLMNAGAKYRFWIPANLAYGQQGSPPAIGPNETLIFDVELLSFR